MKMTCPKCRHEFAISLKAVVPESQKLTFTITLANEDTLLQAKTLGGIISESDKLFKAVGRDMGQKVDVFVTGMTALPGSISVEFTLNHATKQFMDKLSLFERK